MCTQGLHSSYQKWFDSKGFQVSSSIEWEHIGHYLLLGKELLAILLLLEPSQSLNVIIKNWR